MKKIILSTLLITLLFSSCKKKDDDITVVDNTTTNNTETTIQDLLSTTSKNSFDTISNDLWLEITASEYAKLQSDLKNITVAGIKDSNFITPNSTFSKGYTQAPKVGVYNDLIIDAIPEKSYVFAFKFVSKVTSVRGVKLKLSETQNSGFNDYGNELNLSSSINKTHYFVLKTDNMTNSQRYLAFYTGTSVLGGLTSNTIPRYYYRGDATATTTLTESKSNVPLIQTLSSTKKQW